MFFLGELNLQLLELLSNGELSRVKVHSLMVFEFFFFWFDNTRTEVSTSHYT